MTETKGAEAAQTLANFVNAMGHNPDEFVEQLTQREHRTLQQSAFALMLACIEAWADKEEFQFDGRNEDTVRISRIIKARLLEEGLGLSLHKMVRYI